MKTELMKLSLTINYQGVQEFGIRDADFLPLPFLLLC